MPQIVESDGYFLWLAVLTGKDGSHLALLETLHSMDYVVYLPLDQNRADSGRELRNRYEELTAKKVMQDRKGSVSFLEFLIALASDMAFQTVQDNDEPSLKLWFGVLLRNMGLITLTDDLYDIDSESVVRAKVAKINFRSYSSSGNGGLFPMEKTNLDFREIELWYQMQHWLEEQTEIQF